MNADDPGPASGGSGAASVRQCPRCGGPLQPRPKRPGLNPFLADTGTLTCRDCGLDIDTRTDSAKNPWGKGR